MSDDLILEISRRIPAPREDVFAAWVEPEQLARWYGPGVFGNEDIEVDLTVGGRFQVVMVAPSGDRYPAGGEFVEIDPPARIVYRDTSPELSDAFMVMVRAQLEEIGADPNTSVAPIVTVTFEDAGDETDLKISTQFETPEAREALRRMQMVEGWIESLDTLVDLLG